MSILISIVTVTYNSAKTLKDTIDSILDQTYDHIEYIIIDGNSTDNTLKIIKSYTQSFRSKNINFHYISEPDSGIYEAMNKGIALSKGALIGILNSDDWYFKNTLSNIVELNNIQPEAIISGKTNMVNAEKKILKTVQNKKNIKKYIYKTMPINHTATFVPKSIYKRIGTFDVSYKLSADYEFILRAFLKKTPFIFTDEILVNMRNTGSTYQIKNIFITAKEDYSIRKKYNIKLAYFYYLKRLGFNYLLIIRDKLRTLMQH